MAKKKVVEMPAAAAEHGSAPLADEDPVIVLAPCPTYTLRADLPDDIKRLIALRDLGFVGLDGILREFELWQA
jgi:hypothetical protein